MIAELEALAGFRADVREWCREHVPADWVARMTGASVDESLEFQRVWLAELREGGLAAPHWSSEWTGRDYSFEEEIVIAAEMARARAPRRRLSAPRSRNSVWSPTRPATNSMRSSSAASETPLFGSRAARRPVLPVARVIEK